MRISDWSSDVCSSDLDAFVMFDDVEVPKSRVFIDGNKDVYNSVMFRAWYPNVMQQTTTRALTKLEFAYGLASLLAEAVNDTSPHTIEALGEIQSYVEVNRRALLLAQENAAPNKGGVWFPDGRPPHPMRSLMATWFPRIKE